MTDIQIPFAHAEDSTGYFVVHWESARILFGLVSICLTMTIASVTVM